MSIEQLLPGIVGQDFLLRELTKKITKIASSDRAIYLQGPTGCGKELFAHAIHKVSGCNGDFIAVNCSAIPESLFESLLFGHDRGAFTGADKRQDGYLTQAREGTLFLDEIAELPILQQAKLLRVLETRKYQRIGSSQELEFSGRIITATHANIIELIKQRLFREDLYYRINTFELRIPSLEERRGDIPLLVAHFSSQVGDVIFSTCALDYLQFSSWPGNIRQLKNIIDRISILTDDSYITAESIKKMNAYQPATQSIAKLAKQFISVANGDKIKAMADAMVSEALQLNQGNKTKAAELLGVHRKVVERRCQKMPLEEYEMDIAEGQLQVAVC